MSKQIVYRVQDSEGRGPWRPGFSDKWVEYRPDCENLAPWPIEFGRNAILASARPGMAIGCGCRTLDQLRRWFTESEYRTLQGYGYQAVRMVVGRVLAESEIQLVFERMTPLHQCAEPVELYATATAVFSEGRA